MIEVSRSSLGVFAVVIVTIFLSALVSSFNFAEAIVSGHSATQMHYREYPYNLLVPFFTIVCSSLLATILLHYYRTQWGRKSVITK